MKGVCLKFFVHQFQKHKGMMLYEWLLKEGKELGVSGGTAVLAQASFGHHGHIQESHFYELGGGNLTIEVSFALSPEKGEELKARVKQEKLDLFHIAFPIDYGHI